MPFDRGLNHSQSSYVSIGDHAGAQRSQRLAFVPGLHTEGTDLFSVTSALTQVPSCLIARAVSDLAFHVCLYVQRSGRLRMCCVCHALELQYELLPVRQIAMSNEQSDKVVKNRLHKAKLDILRLPADRFQYRAR